MRIVDDVRVSASPYSADVAYAATANPSEVTLGRLASYVRDRRIPLEMCPSSNVQTGAAESVALHPISLLKRLRFRVTVNTDNRLMSNTSLTKEMALLSDAFGYDIDDLEVFQLNAAAAAFLPLEEREELADAIVAGFEND